MTEPTLQTLDVNGLRMQVAKKAARWCCYAPASLNFGFLAGAACRLGGRRLSGA
jgi:hypothetical protein